MYLGRIGLGYAVPGPRIPVPQTYTVQTMAVAPVPGQRGMLTTQAVAPVPGSGGIDVTGYIGEPSIFSPTGSSRSRTEPAQETFDTPGEMHSTDQAQAEHEAAAADSADELNTLIDGSGFDRSAFERTALPVKSFFTQYKTPILIGGAVVGALVIWQLIK